MTAEQLGDRVTEAAFVFLFVLSLVRAIRSPRLTKIHTALFFGAIGMIVLLSWTYDLTGFERSRTTSFVTQALLLFLPYPLLRLADDFTGVPSAMLRAAEAGYALLLAGLALTPDPLPGWLALAAVAYFTVVAGYSTVRFMLVAGEVHGVSRWRMRSLALGSLFLVTLLVVIGTGATADGGWVNVLSNVATIGAGVAYYLGFATPNWLRQVLQAPEIQRFVEVTFAATPRIYGGGAGFEEIETAAGAALGTPHTYVVLWSEEDQRLVAPSQGGPVPGVPQPSATLVARAFRDQHTVFTDDATKADPANAEVYRAMGAKVLLSAPITLDGVRYGMLTAFSQRAPLIHSDDLSLLQTMADQVAIVLRDRELLAELSHARAQEETMRIKDDFFSAAAHDLKTPLTTILGQGQRIQRQLRRGTNVDGQAVDHIVQQAVRMRRLVEELLDEVRLERGQYLGDRVPTELLALARDVAEYVPREEHEISVEGHATVAPVDPDRLRQVLINLLENAAKYSPAGGDIGIRVFSTEGRACIAVSDQGVGIPESDIDVIFERFARGSRADDPRFTGLGVGLYLCRRIVEEHGGVIEVQSRPDEGSTFTVHLPLEASQATAEHPAEEARADRPGAATAASVAANGGDTGHAEGGPGHRR